MIPAHDVKIATEAIDRSGAADIFDAALRTDRRGRKRHTGTRLFLIGALLTVQHRREITSVGIHKVLTTQISHDMQFALGVRYWHNEEVRTIPKSKIDYLVKTMARKLDWSHESQPELSDDERDRRRAAVNDICDRLLDATLIESDSTMRHRRVRNLGMVARIQDRQAADHQRRPRLLHPLGARRGTRPHGTRHRRRLRREDEEGRP